MMSPVSQPIIISLQQRHCAIWDAKVTTHSNNNYCHDSSMVGDEVRGGPTSKIFLSCVHCKMLSLPVVADPALYKLYAKGMS